MSADIDEAVRLARAIESLPYPCTKEQMLKLTAAVIALAEENAALRAVASNAADLLESRSDKPQRKLGADFIRRELASTTRDRSGR